MEGRNSWGSRVGKRTPGGCKDGILQGMQKITVPGATMDKTNGNKIFPQGKAAVGRDKTTAMSIKTLMAIAWLGIQMPHKITYTEEETSPRGAAGYRLAFDFKREISGDIRVKLPVPFLQYWVQQV